MIDTLRGKLLPPAQRRTLEELTDDLDLRSGDHAAKASAFWTMLTLSAIIASAGVLSDSTATVIGAMIIAPLSTPIMGIALAAVKRRRNGSILYVVLGSVLVIVIGVVFSRVLPGSYDLLGNSQISSRVSPGLLDLIAALATGLAGAVALARRDVAAVLPGVAIAISLVPPLAVVGICLGRGALTLSAGALLLFLSNLVAMVLAGMFVYTVLGYTEEVFDESPRSPRKTYVTLGVLFVLVLVPLALNTSVSYYVDALTARVETAAKDWVKSSPGAEVTKVDQHSLTFQVDVRLPGELPPTADLMSRLEDELPDGFTIVVDTTNGEVLDAGTTGK